MPGNPIELGVVRLVGAPEAQMVGHDRPVAGLNQGRDEVAV